MAERFFKIVGNKQDLDTIEDFLRHAEYLGKVGASRNLTLRVDGDGDGRIHVYTFDNSPTAQLCFSKNNPKSSGDKKYNIEQNIDNGATVGIYDVG